MTKPDKPAEPTQTKAAPRWSKLDAWLATVDQTLAEHETVNAQAKKALDG